METIVKPLLYSKISRDIYNEKSENIADTTLKFQVLTLLARSMKLYAVRGMLSVNNSTVKLPSLVLIVAILLGIFGCFVVIFQLFFLRYD